MPAATSAKQRHSARLREYDYASSGAYFVTICAYGREQIFGQVLEGMMKVNIVGEIILEEWQASAQIRQELALDTFVVMPNHIHGIVWILEQSQRFDDQPRQTELDSDASVGAHGRAPLHPSRSPLVRKPRSLGSFVAGFKSAVTKRVNESRGTPGIPVWQRNYHDRVIRDDRELNAMREYITANTANWSRDFEAQTDLELHEVAFSKGRVLA